MLEQSMLYECCGRKVSAAFEQTRILIADRTAEVANLAALNPEAYTRVAPLEDAQFSNGSAAAALKMLTDRPDAILLDADMADFLQAKEGDTIRVLLSRGTSEQVEIEMRRSHAVRLGEAVGVRGGRVHGGGSGGTAGEKQRPERSHRGVVAACVRRFHARFLACRPRGPSR